MQIGRRDYETRKAARIERLHARAHKAQSESEASFGRASAISERFYGGQPILVGHHSEGRARRDQARMHQAMARSVALGKEAAKLHARASSAESDRAISSDDPAAVVRLRAKLTDYESQREQMKELNKIHRKGGWVSVAAKVGEEEAGRLKKRASHTADACPYPAYCLTNLGGEIRRLKKRLSELEAQAARPEREPVKIGEVEIREEDNRVMILFPDKPPEETRERLKSRGFRWAPSTGAWQRMSKPGVWDLAVLLVESTSS